MMSCIKTFWILIAISCTIEAFRMNGPELETLEEVRIPTHLIFLFAIFKGLSTNYNLFKIYLKNHTFFLQKLDNITNLAGNSHKYFIEEEDEGRTFEEAKNYLQSEEIYTSKDHQVGVGVLIDNYSKYTLMFPTVDFASVSSHAGTVYTFRT